MLNTSRLPPSPSEMEELLPWFSTGALSPREAGEVERALQRDASLTRRFARVREELAETVHVNEVLGGPSPRALHKLFAAIDAEEKRAAASRRNRGVTQRLAAALGRHAPGPLMWLAAGVMAALAVMHGVSLFGDLVKDRRAHFLSIPQDGGGVGLGSHVAVRFAPQASAATITRFLDSYRATIVEGPSATGLYRIRVAAVPLPAKDLARLVRDMQSEVDVVSFASPLK